MSKVAIMLHKLAQNSDLMILIVVSLLFVLKLYEFFRGTHWAWRHGSPYADELLLAVERWSEIGFRQEEFADINRRHFRVWSPAAWPVNKAFWRLPSPIKEVVVNWVFRFPTLTIVLIGLICLSSNNLVIGISAALLFMGLWIVTIHHLVYRLTHGYMDNYFSRTVSTQMIPYPDPQPDELNPSRRKLMREFAKVFVWLLLLIVLGYTGIYTGLSKILGSDKAFTGVSSGGWELPVDLLYFSIVTLATVGFGDISPVKDAVVVRLAVASQIVAGMFLLVFLLTSFSLTLEPEHPKRNSSE